MSKFRITVNYSWEFDTDQTQEEALEHIKQQLAMQPPQVENLRDVRLEKLKLKLEKVRLAQFSFEDIFPHITKKKKEYEVNGTKYVVKMNSQRYFLFRECSKCVACNLPGTKVFLEHDPLENNPHFNVYGEEDGQLILMTKDHIHAKSCGGEDYHSNYQTMCVICNSLKGNTNLTLEAIKQLRLLYNENKNKLTKKKLNLLLEETKANLARPWQGPPKRSKKTTKDALVLLDDINIFCVNNELVAYSVYSDTMNLKHVACLRRGTVLEPLIYLNKQYLCQMSDQEVFLIAGSLVHSIPKGS